MASGLQPPLFELPKLPETDTVGPVVSVSQPGGRRGNKCCRSWEDPASKDLAEGTQRSPGHNPGNGLPEIIAL